jgi:hypothetical protein
MAVLRPLAEVVGVQLEKAALKPAPDHSPPEHRLEHVREDADDVEAHPSRPPL